MQLVAHNPPATPLVQGHRSQETVRLVWERYRNVRDRAQPLHLQWAETFAAILGDAYKVARGGTLVNIGALRRGDVELLTASHNFLWQSLRAMVANVLQNDPQPECTVLQPGERAKEMARVNEKLLGYFYRDKGFWPAMHDTVTWAAITGTGFLGTFWDAMAGKPVRREVKRNGEAVYQDAWADELDEAGNPMMAQHAIPPHPVKVRVQQAVTELVMSGDLRYVAGSPFHIFPEPVEEWADVGWMIHRQYASRDRLIDAIGSKARSLVPDVVDDAAIGLITDSYSAPNERMNHQDLVRLLVYYETPSIRHEGGRCILVGNQMLLQEIALPAGRLPFEPVYDTRMPGRLFGIASASQALNPQRNLNAAETDLWRTRRLTGTPKLLVRTGSMDRAPERLSDRVGGVWPVNQGHDYPKYLEPPQMPAWASQAPDRLQLVIERIFGVQGASRGDEKGLMSGRQASVLQRADQAKWGPMVTWLARAVARSSEAALMLWKVYGPPQTTHAVYGPFGSPTEVQTWIREYTPDNIAVTVLASALMPYNPEARRQAIMEMWQVGMIPDVHAATRLLRHAELGQVLGDDEPSRAQARYEQKMFLDQGKPHDPAPHEDQRAHMDVHLAAMRSPEYYTWTPQRQALYQDHVAKTQMFIAAELQSATNPVLSGASQMPGLAEGGAQRQNLPPTMNGAPNAMGSPGMNPQQEQSF